MPESSEYNASESRFRRLEGSERRPAPHSEFLGPADSQEKVTVTIVLRRRPSAPPIPNFDYFATNPPGIRRRISVDEFAERYGSDAADIKRVVRFAETHALAVVAIHRARRTVVVSGTVAQMNMAFQVNLGRYRRTLSFGRFRRAGQETYRGREGFIHIPDELAGIIIGVFGLDNRSIVKLNGADPPNTANVTVPEITKLYDFPSNSAEGQTIGIISVVSGYDLGNYDPADLQKYFGDLSRPVPQVIDVEVDAVKNFLITGDPETTQDICIAGSAAPGAAIAVYFTFPNQLGWVHSISRVVHPDPGDPVCAVLSSSFYLSDGDDNATLLTDGVTKDFVNAMTMAFQDAALQSVTVCIASGDTGTDSKVGDGKAHVQYPASDPWVLSVGGTTVGNIQSGSFDEYVWNDTIAAFSDFPTATGGGVSDFFPQPMYQSDAAVPVSINDGHVGRGVPDIAANASWNSGYPIPFSSADDWGLPNPFPGNGTSASAPLWAGLIAVLNAALGENVGFFNPLLYQLGPLGVCRDITAVPGAADNGLNGVPGYPTDGGWDACTGWGSPNGMALLQAIQLRRELQSLLATELTIDPLALLLRGDLYVKIHLPYPIPITAIRPSIQQLVQAMSPAQRIQALAQAEALRTYASVLQEELHARALQSAVA